VGALVGATSILAAAVGTTRATRVLMHHRRLRCTDTCPLEFIDTDDVYAYTLPGPARTIAISAGLRNSLDDHEFDVVLAHERSHARNRHDRFKLLGLVTAAFVPPATRLTARLDFHLERWADEDALAQTGGDRRLTARTIAKVALARASPHPALGIADHGVAARATALLRPVEQPGLGTRLQTSLAIATTLAFAAYQLHHSVVFAADLIS
jgi:beta-lactamase regulating signal transducer with metallopeptidase domain